MYIGWSSCTLDVLLGLVLTIANLPENLGRADTYIHVNAYGKCKKYPSVLGWHSNPASVPSRSIPNLAFFKGRIDVFAYE